MNTLLNFSFVIFKDGFRFEENTLQEYEEPIYLPTYVYTMLLTYGQTRTENRLAPYEIRFVIYFFEAMASERAMTILKSFVLSQKEVCM